MKWNYYVVKLKIKIVVSAKTIFDHWKKTNPFIVYCVSTLNQLVLSWSK